MTSTNPSATLQIRDAIRQAKNNADELERLGTQIQRQLPSLHNAIRLPAADPQAALMDFVLRYIDHAPNFIDALRGLTHAAGIDDYASIFLDIAEEFFSNPPAAVHSTTGLEALLYQAYLTHRLIEEVNDRVISHCGVPLAPMDMTRANLVIHELIGEPFANDLDFVVHYSTEIHMDKEAAMDNNQALHRFAEQQRQQGWQAELDQWPCLAENLSINLELDPQPEPPAKH